MPERRRPGRTPPVIFDSAYWSQDMIRASAAAREVAAVARREFAAEGVLVNRLRPCASEGPDGTSLPHSVKVYVPHPAGPHGMVFDIDQRDGHLVLAFLAFGLRHPTREMRQPSVYEVAHRRMYQSSGS